MNQLVEKKNEKGRFFQYHNTSIVEDGALIGEATVIWHFSHIMSGAKIGTHCSLGQNTFIGSQAVLGNRVKVQNNVSIYDQVLIKDDVFCGPSVVFTNVINPRAFINRKKEYQPTQINRGATLGANATIICGTTIGQYALIGAGTVVAKDIADYALVVGVPGKQIGWVCQCGERLPENYLCSTCLKRYIKKNDRLQLSN